LRARLSFEFPPSAVTLHWFEAFFASPAFVIAFFRVSLMVGLLAAALATVLGTSAALGLVRLRSPSVDLDLALRLPHREARERVRSGRASKLRPCVIIAVRY
jgi:ABC-type spermidine/putrescine transport system permease subunit II